MTQMLYPRCPAWAVCPSHRAEAYSGRQVPADRSLPSACCPLVNSLGLPPPRRAAAGNMQHAKLIGPGPQVRGWGVWHFV